MEEQNNPFQESNDFIRNSFMEVIGVLDEYIQDEELKKETFAEMARKFSDNLGGFLK